jgi:hypothetical protein
MELTPADHIEIADLSARANQAIDLADPDGWAACYTPDGEYLLDPSGAAADDPRIEPMVVRGTEALRAAAAVGSELYAYRHWTSNRVLTVEGEVVHSVSYTNVLQLSGPTEGQILTGIMREELVRTDEGWRFASRRLRFDK